MARIIHNLSDKIISVTQSQLRTRGYMGTTIRSVAQECGIAVGTVYNYFPDKDALINAAMMGDWLLVLATIKLECSQSTSISEGIRKIQKNLQDFYTGRPWMAEYTNSEDRPSGDYDMFKRRTMLHNVLDSIVADLLVRHGMEKDVHLAVMYTEMILTSISNPSISIGMINDVIDRLYDK